MLRDLRYAIRMIGRAPVFTLVVALSLALGIGANTAIFTLVDAVLIRSLPVRDPGSLVQLQWSGRLTTLLGIRGTRGWSSTVNGVRTTTAFSYQAFDELRARRDVFSTLLAFAPAGRLTMLADGDASMVEGEYVSGSYFSGLGVPAAAGRALTDEDDREAAPPVAVISSGLWKRRFGGDAAVVGKAIAINGKPRTIVGVAPREFFGVQPGEPPDVWVPLASAAELGVTPPPRDTWFWWLVVMGRLAPGVTEAQARAALDPILGDLANATGAGRTPAQLARLQQLQDADARAGRSPATDRDRARLTLLPGRQGPDRLRRQFSTSLMILMAIVGLVLVVACANVASLLLARATARRREIAIRLSIGAARSRLVRQLLTESLLLSAMGAAAGLAFAFWGSRALATAVSEGANEFVLDVSPNMTVLGFTVCVSIATGLLFGFVPALRTTSVAPSLREQRATDGAGQRHRFGLGRALVVVQVALSLLLLIGAGLFVGTLVNLQHVDLGIARANVLLFRLSPGTAGYEGARLVGIYDRLLDALNAQPGVRAATLSRLPLFSGGASRMSLRIEGNEGSAMKPGEELGVWTLDVGPRFPETMGMALVAGRDFGPQDTATSPTVVLVNETMARRFFGTPMPIGRQFNFEGRSPQRWTVVGVVRDAKYSSVQEEVPATVYSLYRQRPAPSEAMVFEVRTAGDPLAFVAAARRVVRDLDGNLPLTDVKTQEAQIDQALYTERIFAQLSSLFAVLTLGLAAIGLYGLLAYAVTRRTPEIGIRVALGARRGDVLWMILREALALAGLGVAIGIPVALAATRVVGTMLFGLRPHDPATIVSAAILLVAVASLAGALPAQRAARVDPMVALREE